MSDQKSTKRYLFECIKTARKELLAIRLGRQKTTSKNSKAIPFAVVDFNSIWCVAKSGKSTASGFSIH
jgi:hypothetical protein